MYLIHVSSAFCMYTLLLLSECGALATPESVPLYHQLLSKLSINKPRELPLMHHCEDQVSNSQATPPHQTSSGKDTNTVLHHQQNAQLQQDNARLQQEVNHLQQENIRHQQRITQLQQDHQQEIIRLQKDHQEEVTRLQQDHAPARGHSPTARDKAAPV